MDKTMMYSEIYGELPNQDDYNDLVKFRRWGVQPPAAMYITLDDTFVVVMQNPSQTVSVDVSMRIMRPDGVLVPMLYQYLNVAPQGIPTLKTIPNLEGFLISLTVDALTATRGTVYVVISLRRGRGAGDSTIGEMICEGYPGGQYLINYPMGLPESPNAGQGFAYAVAVVTPAAGADWTITVPTGTSWMINTISARLVTSATVANRVVTLVINDGGGNVMFNGPAAYVQTAGLNWVYTWSVNGLAPPSGSNQNGGTLPATLRVQPGWTIHSSTTGIQVGDQWSTIVLSVDEFAAM